MAGFLFCCPDLEASVELSSTTTSVLYPADLGPVEIDVSGYPPEHQNTYREVFLKVFGFLRTTSRVINSPVVEFDPRLEEAERRLRPEAFSDPRILLATRDGWKKKVEEIRRRPPCCGACPVLSLQEAKALWKFLVYDSLARKTGPRSEAWSRHRMRLIELFRGRYPERFNEIYAGPNKIKEEEK
ncbi:MAG: hypothetical protein A3G41_06740 [Elusimicrobia bacterium RIFCSPLOWO2_12_FULL_59_9]|nr:MAG: hypothetical protein A3G41_06740 [Elusimicrobia bacterium RIFCSPLOWO2_12_FULL_59_9]